MFLYAAPPHALMRLGGYLFGGQVSIACRMPLLGQDWFRQGEIVVMGSTLPCTIRTTASFPFSSSDTDRRRPRMTDIADPPSTIRRTGVDGCRSSILIAGRMPFGSEIRSPLS